jgi:hypothetical protein
MTFSKSGVDSALFIPFNGICEALKLIVNVQQDVLTAITIVNAKPVSIPPGSSTQKAKAGSLSGFLLPPNSRLLQVMPLDRLPPPVREGTATEQGNRILIIR